MSGGHDPQAVAADDDRREALHRDLNAFWQPPPGLRRLSAVNHSIVGTRFIITGFIFFLIGGILALLMRTQLATPDSGLFDHDTYNQLFTMHGTTMMFLFAVPMIEGFAIYLIPKMIGARDMVFPRLSAYGYWCYLFGGLLLYSSLFIGEAPNGGWFMYQPLTGREFTPGMNSDFWLLGVTFVEISSVTAAVELIVTILLTRAPGMSIQRMPLFAWYMLVVAFMIAFGFPPLILGSILLEVERAFGLPFFEVAAGGDPLLWQHLFWIFGHPEVYIIFLPAAGVVSMLVSTFARRPIAAYSLVVLAVVGTGFLSFGLWVHHMFAVGIPILALSFFSAASMAVSVPSGIQIFAWIATLWSGRPALKVPLLFIFGMFFIFVLGGLTGVMLAVVPFNWQVHDTHFVVAHLHYVLVGGMVFPLFAGLYYWLPLATGRLLSERLGQLAFWLMFIGFNVSFLPMHLTGLLGMPRRIYHYADLPGWAELNLISTVGAYLIATGVLVFIIDAWHNSRRGRSAPVNPWNAGSLEWAIRPPAPPYNFASIPIVSDRYPAWAQPALTDDIEQGRFYLSDPSRGRRETMGTEILGGEPNQVIRLPHPSWMPLVTALATAVFFVGFLVQAYTVAAIGAALTVVAILGWAATTGDRQAPDHVPAGCGRTLPLNYTAAQPPGWWGLIIALLADASIFASLLYAYFYLWTVSGAWPPPEIGMGSLALPTIGLGVLVLSALCLARAQSSHSAGRGWQMQLALLVALLLAVAFGVIQLLDLAEADLAPQQHAYAALVYSIVAFHLLHLAIGVLMVGFVLVRTWLGFLSPTRNLELRNAALFWHYLVVMWVLGFATVHLFPLLA